MPKLPYLKLYPRDFFGSVHVQVLPGAHRLIYLGLLLYEWDAQGEGLPNDLVELARMLAIEHHDMLQAWGDGSQSGISRFFELRNGRLFNPELEDMYAKETEALRKKSEGSKRAANLRWKTADADAVRAQCVGIANAMPRAYDADADVFKEGGKKGNDGGKKTEPNDLAELVDFYSTELCMNPHVAKDIILRLGVDHADLKAWKAVLSEMAGRGLRDYRSFVRSRAMRFKGPSQAFGQKRSEMIENLDFEALLKEAKKESHF